MATLGEIKADIADSVDDTTGEYAGQIAKAITKAIRYCERETYYFNETRDETFVTVDGQEWYGAAANANIPTLVHIEKAYSEDTSGQRTEILRYRPSDIELLADNSASRGEPYCYTYFGQRIRLYPIPAAAVYTIRLQLSPYRLTALTDDNDSNAWTTEAEDMIFARAKYILCKDTLKDAVMAAEALNDYSDQHDSLKRETTGRNASGMIVPTCF